MNRRLAPLLLGLAMWFGLASLASAQFPRIMLSAGIHSIHAEVAYTDPMRQQGLMYRQSMAPQDGMLFVFRRNEPVCMWMKSTYIPLSVAFLDEQGVVINIEDMVPQSEVSHCAVKPARYALEMNVGWFPKRGIRVGSRISGLERAPAAR